MPSRRRVCLFGVAAADTNLCSNLWTFFNAAIAQLLGKVGCGSLFFLISLLPAPASAKPLEFSGITSKTVAIDHPSISCRADKIYIRCKLKRVTFSNVPIIDSIVGRNERTEKVRDIYISASVAHYEDAVKILSVKYGKPLSDEKKSWVGKEGKPYNTRRVEWPKFDGGATLFTRQTSETNFSIFFIFSQNNDLLAPPKVDF